MDMDALMTQQGMRDFTEGERDKWMNDASEIRQLAQIIQARLANTQVDGDSTGTAARRARKVTRPLRKVLRLLEKTAAEMEAFNAVYVRDVLELPDRRAKELDRKALRRQRLGIAASSAQEQITGSLKDTVNSLNGLPSTGNQQVTPLNQAPQYHTATPPSYAYPAPPAHQPAGNFTDQFPDLGKAL